LSLLPDKFCPGENVHQLLAKVVGHFFRRWLGEVVIRTFGWEFGSQSEKCDANGSECMSKKVPGAIDAPSVGTVFGSLESSIGREMESFKHHPVSSVDRQSIRKGQTPFDRQGCWGRSGPTYKRCLTNYPGNEMKEDVLSPLQGPLVRPRLLPA